MPITSDPNDPRLTHGIDKDPKPQAEVYLVLSEEERAKGFVRPYRDAYRHVGTETAEGCGTVTSMGRALSETYCVNPRFYGSTYCVSCSKHLAVNEFVWIEKDGQDGPRVGT